MPLNLTISFLYSLTVFFAPFRQVLTLQERASVRLYCANGKKILCQASGFVIKSRGGTKYLITNLHVAACGADSSRAGRQPDRIPQFVHIKFFDTKGRNAWFEIPLLKANGAPAFSYFKVGENAIDVVALRLPNTVSVKEMAYLDYRNVPPTGQLTPKAKLLIVGYPQGQPQAEERPRKKEFLLFTSASEFDKGAQLIGFTSPRLEGMSGSAVYHKDVSGHTWFMGVLSGGNPEREEGYFYSSRYLLACFDQLP